MAVLKWIATDSDHVLDGVLIVGIGRWFHHATGSTTKTGAPATRPGRSVFWFERSHPRRSVA